MLEHYSLMAAIFCLCLSLGVRLYNFVQTPELESVAEVELALPTPPQTPLFEQGVFLSPLLEKYPTQQFSSVTSTFALTNVKVVTLSDTTGSGNLAVGSSGFVYSATEVQALIDSSRAKHIAKHIKP